MPRESYCTPFLDFVGQPNDPHDCWQEDGFWPERVAADLNDLLVWGTEIGLSYLNNGGMVAYLNFISGRTLPEMERGFAVLKCLKSAAVCGKTRQRFGAEFPRNDSVRESFVAADEEFFECCGSELWTAMESDDYENVAEAYYKRVCLAHSIQPWIYPDRR